MNKYLNKYLIIILAVVIIIVFAVDLGNKGGFGTNHFDNGVISFDYPGSWNEINGTGSNVVSFSNSNGLNVTVSKQSLPPGYNLADHIQLNGIANIDKNFQLLSSKNITINGTNAYENDYNVQGNNGTQKRIEIWFEKNNLLYSVIYTSPGEIKENTGDSALNAIGNDGNGLSTMINSIKINDTGNNPSKIKGWAELIMPDIGGDWLVNSNTVNDPGVYHIPTSYYPGENGQMALLGHHTTHSAPFMNIDQLKPGNTLIIKDSVTQKKYTYQVVSNGDVRWGVDGVSINFQATSEPELWLITCWPPGYSRAAWIVHSKLISVQPLN